MSHQPGSVAARIAAVFAIALGALCLAGVPALAAEAPVIEGESVSHLSSTDATLEAEINTGGVGTHYQLRLEYGCDISGNEACAQFCVVPGPCPGPVNGPVNIPLPGGELPGSSEVEHVSLDLHEAGVTLEPGTRYRYSIEATSNAGTAKGPGQIFTTPSGSQPAVDIPPSIESESVSRIRHTEATLEAQINPQSSERGTRYQFQVVENPSEYQSRFTCPTEGFPAGTSLCLSLTSQPGALPIGLTEASTQNQSVNAFPTLKPDTTYHYRVIAARTVQTVDTIAWEEPIVYGPDQTFTTPAPGGEPEAPITEPCSGPINAGAGMKLCGKLNPNHQEKAGFYFAYNTGASCEGGFSTPPQAEAEVQDEEVSAELFGLQAATQYSYCLVAYNELGETFGGSVSFTTESRAPLIESVTASQITQHRAHLEATINPDGGETSYEIWFLPGCSAGACERVPAHVVAKATDIGNGHEGLGVGVGLTELQPGLSNNEYWVVASNSAGKSESAHQKFATPPQPRIESESASAITEHDATLEAQINPEGLPKGADYQFQLVKNTSEYPLELVCAEHGVVQPVGDDGCLDPPGWPSGVIPLNSVGGSDGKLVSLDLASVGVTLQPGTTYHYRVLAAESLNGEDGVLWEAPAVSGPDQTFTTVSASHARPLGGEETPSGNETPSTTSTTGQPGASSGGVSSLTPSAMTPASPLVKSVKIKPLTRAQKLKRALELCVKKPKKGRAACAKKARRLYGAAVKKPKR